MLGGFYFDPLYLILTAIGFPLIYFPQQWVKSTYEKFDKEFNRNGYTGAQVAQQMLEQHGIRDVRVEETPGVLSDHYDPGAKAVRLSSRNFRGSSIAAATIAAHEVGHAIQHNTGYFPVVLRGKMAPAVGLGSQLGPILFMIGLFLPMFLGLPGDLAYLVALAGVTLFGLSVAFHIVTLPVELDASHRALKVLAGSHYLTQAEMPGAEKVLKAAAFTYVAAALYSLMQLAYYLIHLSGMHRD